MTTIPLRARQMRRDLVQSHIPVANFDKQLHRTLQPSVQAADTVEQAMIAHAVLTVACQNCQHYNQMLARRLYSAVKDKLRLATMPLTSRRGVSLQMMQAERGGGDPGCRDI